MMLYCVSLPLGCLYVVPQPTVLPLPTFNLPPPTHQQAPPFPPPDSRQATACRPTACHRPPKLQRDSAVEMYNRIGWSTCRNSRLHTPGCRQGESKEAAGTGCRSVEVEVEVEMEMKMETMEVGDAHGLIRPSPPFSFPFAVALG